MDAIDSKTLPNHAVMASIVQSLLLYLFVSIWSLLLCSDRLQGEQFLTTYNRGMVACSVKRFAYVYLMIAKFSTVFAMRAFQNHCQLC